MHATQMDREAQSASHNDWAFDKYPADWYSSSVLFCVSAIHSIVPVSVSSVPCVVVVHSSMVADERRRIVQEMEKVIESCVVPCLSYYKEVCYLQ